MTPRPDCVRPRGVIYNRFRYSREIYRRGSNSSSILMPQIFNALRMISAHFF